MSRLSFWLYKPEFITRKNDRGFKGIAVSKYNPIKDRVTLRLSQNGYVTGFTNMPRKEYLKICQDWEKK